MYVLSFLYTKRTLSSTHYLLFLHLLYELRESVVDVVENEHQPPNLELIYYVRCLPDSRELSLKEAYPFSFF
jgi:hypothetical protein